MDTFVPTTLAIVARATSSIQPLQAAATALASTTDNTIPNPDTSLLSNESKTTAEAKSLSKAEKSTMERIGKPLLITFIVIMFFLTVCCGIWCAVRIRRKRRARHNGITPPPGGWKTFTESDYFGQETSTITSDKRDKKFTIFEGKTFKMGK